MKDLHVLTHKCIRSPALDPDRLLGDIAHRRRRDATHHTGTAHRTIDAHTLHIGTDDEPNAILYLMLYSASIRPVIILVALLAVRLRCCGWNAVHFHARGRRDSLAWCRLFCFLHVKHRRPKKPDFALASLSILIQTNCFDLTI